MKYVSAVFIAFTLLAAPAWAQKGPVTVKSVAEVETEVKNAQGTIEKKRAPVSQAIPGTQVVYTTTFTNDSGKPAENIALDNPIPTNTTYIDGSAFGDNTSITFSIDGGKAFATPDKLKVKTPEGKERAAVASDYTHIRWAYKGALAVEKSSSAGFRVLIK